MEISLTHKTLFRILRAMKKQVLINNFRHMNIVYLPDEALCHA